MIFCYTNVFVIQFSTKFKPMNLHIALTEL